MSQARRERREQERLARKAAAAPVPASPTAADVVHSRPRTRWLWFVVAALGAILLTAAAGWLLRPAKHPLPISAHSQPPTNRSVQPIASSTPPPSPAPAASPAPPLTLGKLTSMKPEELVGVDVAAMNLLCAQGLPGSENLDVAAGLRTLDEWARHVNVEIARNHHRFVENPAEYEGKEDLFKVVMLILTLQQDLGVHYDAASMGVAALPHATQEQIKADLADEHYFKDSKAAFLNGILGEAHTGTCSSLPVLYAAVGRRLGFPLKLVLAKGHVFVRWDEGKGKERFNMEGTGGVDSLPDEHYREWPLPLSPEEVASGEYLRSLTPAEELATFLETRAECLRANGRMDEALVAMSEAYRLRPGSFNSQISLDKTAEAVTARVRPPPPAQNIHSNNPFAEIEQVEALNRANRQHTYEQGRPSGNGPAMPPPSGYPQDLSRHPTPAGPPF